MAFSTADEASAAYQSQLRGLEDRISQQAADFAAQQQRMQEQLAAQQAAYDELTRQTANSQRAYTPAPQETASEMTTADSEEGVRGRARSRLTSLAIIEGLGTNANPLSGLQLA